MTKEYLGWEEVQVLDLRSICTLVAMAWVVVGFFYRLGMTLEWAEVQLLTKLGGWGPRHAHCSDMLSYEANHVRC